MRRNIILFVSLLILASLISPISAAADEEAEKKAAVALEQTLKKTAEGQKETEIQGLVIDQTQTLMGETFYQTFVTFWEAPPEAGEDYNIVIVERASASWGSLVWVVVDDKIVYQAQLRPRSGDIEESARDGVVVASQYLSTDYRGESGAEDEDLKGDGY